MRSGRALPSVASMSNQIAVITGASRGLGRALAAGLAREGYALIIDARNAAALEAATVAIWDAGGTVTAIPGDVTDPAHRAALLRAVDQAGRLDLLVNNAGTLGASPLPALADYPVDELRTASEVMFSTAPPLARSRGSSSWVSATGAMTFTSNAARSSSGG